MSVELSRKSIKARVGEEPCCDAINYGYTYLFTILFLLYSNIIKMKFTYYTVCTLKGFNSLVF